MIVKWQTGFQIAVILVLGAWVASTIHGVVTVPKDIECIKQGKGGCAFDSLDKAEEELSKQKTGLVLSIIIFIVAVICVYAYRNNL